MTTNGTKFRAIVDGTAALEAVNTPVHAAGACDAAREGTAKR